jgi:hypothetical protein
MFLNKLSSDKFRLNKLGRDKLKKTTFGVKNDQNSPLKKVDGS